MNAIRSLWYVVSGTFLFFGLFLFIVAGITAPLWSGYGTHWLLLKFFPEGNKDVLIGISMFVGFFVLIALQVMCGIDTKKPAADDPAKT